MADSPKVDMILANMVVGSSVNSLQVLVNGTLDGSMWRQFLFL